MGNKIKSISSKPITVSMQFAKILNGYANIRDYRLGKNSFDILMDIKPLSSSKTYNIKIKYKLAKRPIIIVLNIKNDIKLPHTYLDNELCLYYPKFKEWNKNKYISDTIIPWISEWLYFYEIWIITGKWIGGGIEHA